ncbi:MAG: class I poly(R)-hydroxyalkanoic acid synthase [Rhodospirillales bacterium]|nr:class I poly(R)-hydroxyalkanoic acid synthase [Rhodospirillales bacterium]
MQEIMAKYGVAQNTKMADPLNLQQAYFDFAAHLLSDPQKLTEMQMKFWQDWGTLWQESAKRFMGQESHTLYEPEKGDRRFQSPAWQESALFDFIKQSYLLTGRWIGNTIQQTEGLDSETRQKLDFQARQFINAIAPTNFLLTNPEVLQETINTNGDNLVRGLENMLEDIERGHGELSISTTDYQAFKIGKNLAVTPGRVVFRNDLMELIQYEPLTEKAYKKPLLIIPPWINKYYILDLQEHNSLIRWAVEQGHTVFTISWVNPDKKLAQKRFEDYMDEGVLTAMNQIEQITGQPDCNVLGYCLGGTLLAITLAWLAAKGQDKKIASATFLTTLVDFADAGELKMFMDKTQLDLLDREMAETGIFPAESFKKTFSLLRANDMIWSFVINNYLMGREPFPFDLLYWNDDATNMPAAMHSFYLRKCYNENLLPVPGGVVMNGEPIDITSIKTPSYFLSTREDHIAPWKATYATTQLVDGPVTFTLAASGHVAGVINPPAKNKYCFWTSTKTPKDPDEWLKQARQEDGSWWPHWSKWLAKHAGEKIAARKPAKGLCAAPGTYIKMKS